EEDGKKYLYRNLNSEFIRIFDSLSKGIVPDVESNPVNRVPDLKHFLIEYGEYRVRQTFTRDQVLRKIRLAVPDLDESINRIYGRVRDILPVFGMDQAQLKDPCGFFSTIFNSNAVPEQLTQLLEAGKDLCQARSRILSLLADGIRDIMPNTCQLAGEDISLALLAEAGSLRSLAEMPASGIQVLGAETALFKHLTTGSPPPKHGVIFKFPGITSLPKKLRGRACRVAANQIAICVRADFLGRRIDVAPLKAKIDRALAIRE
ncbi:MAG: hypothetical protein QXV22_01250, partial [Thermoplasmataceae archaeon]